MDFKKLAEERRRFRELCRRHIPSLSAFKYAEGPSFKLTCNEPIDEPSETKLHHLTNTATCIESLQDCHQIFQQKGMLGIIGKSVHAPEEEKAIEQLTTSFYAEAFKRKKWLSEGSAPVYCASRALPLFLNAKNEWTSKHANLVKSVYKQLAATDRFGIGEKNLKKNKKKNDPKWYPENAYHTYWALVVHRIVSARFPDQAREALGSDLESQKQGMRLWARAKLAEEMGLHWAESATLDSDQLTWALTTFIEFEGDLSSNLRAQTLIRKGFEALGSTQQNIGSWRHYAPLFVYSDVGNAYCYVYESFTYLLKAVLGKLEKEEFLQDVMRGFVDRLQKLREYAEMTQVRLGEEPDAVGWSSGHRPAESEPEGWATATVFSFLQAYRRLLGVLARRDALRSLPALPLSKSQYSIGVLAQRGDTWSAPGKPSSVVEELVTLFINPLLGRDPSLTEPEPDDQPIQEWQARSAILFGPPGTSKTTLARCVAAALGWKYVELYSSHFVAEGINAIQRAADRIFALLMELDHAVVLFDEPDELVREREGSPDAFGRFLTTSMLPKLAELWKQRRIIYFVATNHISYFDAAIIRSERFDLVVSVPPPSFEKKVERLKERLGKIDVRNVSINVTPEQVAAKLDEISELSRNRRSGTEEKPWPGDEELPPDAQLAKLVLLRWDQIDELASRIASRSREKDSLMVDADLLTSALKEIADPGLSNLQAYVDYLAGLRYVRRDFQRKPVFSVRECPPDPSVRNELEEKDGHFYLKCKSGDCPEELVGYRVVRTRTSGEIDILAPTRNPSRA
ncbi:MAG: ATP-binding protein [Terriglobia bacterium]|jgi:hypothetical protein